jgi:hypothetical protein
MGQRFFFEASSQASEGLHQVLRPPSRLQRSPEGSTRVRSTQSRAIASSNSGSHDGTCAIVQRFPVRLVRTLPSLPPGIGCQINQGAQQA